MTSLLVASSGGHLDELVELADRFVPPGSGKIWVTPRTPHAESLLVDQPTTYVPAVGARQLGAAARALPSAWSLVRRIRPERVVTTGAALCVPYVVAARAMRIPVQFIDSATRLSAPSLTGRLLRRVPGVDLRYQGEGWPSLWSPTPSVFSGFEPGPLDTPRARHVVVALGTERFPFPRAVDAVASALPIGCEVTWQLGHTPAPAGLPGEVHDFLPFAELAERIAASDVVVTHAGVGSVLTALRAGKRPVVLPRRAVHGEHVDDHQRELARLLVESEIVVDGTVDDLWPAVLDAASRAARRR